MTAHRTPGIQDNPIHPDYPLLRRIEEAMVDAMGGYERLGDFIASMLRKVIDDVIDTAGTGRRSVSELEKTEKTYIGTKIEIVLRHALKMPRGNVLDLLVDGHEADVKFTVGGRAGNWMVPPEAVGHILVLIAASEQEHLCWMGLIVADEAKLTRKPNRDVKRSISSAGFDQIFWLLNGRAYEANFWAGVPKDVADQAFDEAVSGSKRMARLFRQMLRKPIPRRVVEEVTRQADFMRRVRRNGGARDLMGPDVVILHPYMGRDAIENLNLGRVPVDAYVAVDIQNEKERQIIEQSSQTRTTRAWAARRPKPKGPIERITERGDNVALQFTDEVDSDFDAPSQGATT